MSNSFYALVLAGGSGTRFWPLSRKVKPKQLLTLFNEQSLLEETVTRLAGLIPVEKILKKKREKRKRRKEKKKEGKDI